MKRLLLIFFALLTFGVSGAWAQVTSITDGDMYTIRLNKATTYFFGYHYKTTSDAAPFKFVYAGESEGDYKLYYLQCPFTGLYLHSTRTNKDGSNISLEWVSSTSSATSYTVRPTASGATTFRIFPKESTYSLTAWNSNAANYNIIPWDNNSDLGVWNLISANNVNEYEFQVNDLTGDFSRTGGGTSDWKDKWDAKASLFSLQITTTTNNSSYRYDMTYSSSNLQMASSSDKTAYYTMTAPDGCVISGYRISGTTNGAITLIKGDGTSIDYASGATLTNVGESVIARKVTKFTLKGENKVITGSLYIKVRKLKTITSVSEIDRNKCYAIDTKDRGNWSVRNNYSYLTRNKATGLNIASDFSDAKQQFAFVYYDGTDNETDDGAYYLYSVSAQKFITALGTDDNSLVTLDTKGTQSISFLSSGITNYPVCIEMSNTADLNVRSDTWEAGVTVYGTSGSNKDDDGNAVRIYEIADFNPAAAEDTWNTADVTYSLYYNGTKIGDDVVVEDVTAGTPAIIPSSMDNGFMTYTYTPAIISSLSPTVRIDATWNGPFQISSAPSDGSFASDTKWYTVGIHSAHESDNHIWKYNSSDDLIATETVATNAFGSVSNNHLFCFVGNPYSGFSIYNKAAGSSKTLYKSTTNNEQAKMATTGSLFVPSVPTQGGKTVATGYSCFQLKDQTTRLNCYDNDSYKLKGWGDSGNGSTCWFLPEGQYYLTYLNTLLLTPPANAVGTSAYITTEEAKTIVINHKTSLEQDLFYLNDDNRMSIKTILNGINRSGTNALTDGYYRLVNAFPDWTTTNPCVYYDSAADRMKWSKASNASDNVNSIVKLTTETPSIYTPNGQKYMKLARTDNADQLGDEAATTSFTSLGDAQYNITVGGQVLHTQGHSNGTGSADVLVGFSASANTASSWYLVKVTSLPITLNDGGDDYYYATLYLPFDATISGATAYTMRQSGNWLIPTEVENNKVPAGTPVLLRGTSASATATINTGDAFSSLSGLDANFTGTYTEISTARATGEYILSKKDGVVGFYQRGTGKKILANRAYLQLDADISQESNVKGFYLDFDGIATDIKDIENVYSGSDAIYNIAGQRVKAAQKGLYIINGKKVLVK